MSYTITDGTDSFDLIELDIKKELDKLNTATVKIDGVFGTSNINTSVDIKLDSNIIFSGIIKKEDVEEYTEIRKLTIMEKARELKDLLVESSSGSGNYNFKITSDSVNDIVDRILDGSGWTRQSSDTSTIDNLSFFYTSKLNALYQILIEQLDYHVWFDNDNQYVYFGTSRTDLTGTNLDYYSKQIDEESFGYGIDKVIVIGNDDSIQGSSGSGTTVKVYQDRTVQTNDEASRLAQTILDKINASSIKRIVCKITPTNDYDEGDLVTVDGVDYIVFDVNETFTTTELGLNRKKKDINDILPSTVYEVTGDVSLGAEVSYDGGEKMVSSSYDAVYNKFITDTSDIDSFTLKVELKKLRAYVNDQTQQYTDVDIDNVVMNVTSNMLSVPSLTSASGSNNGMNRILFQSGTMYEPYSDGFSLPYTNSDGYQFYSGYCFFTYSSVGDTSTENLFLDVSIEKSTDNGSSWGVEQSFFEIETVPNSEYEINKPITFPFIITGDSSPSTNNKVRFSFYAYSPDILSDDYFEITNFYTQVIGIPRHTHSLNSSYSDGSISDPGHTHSDNFTEKELDSYPSNVVVKVNGTTVISHSGGSNMTLSGDITSYLQNGNNTITVTSDTLGAVDVYGNYIGYGS